MYEAASQQVFAKSPSNSTPCCVYGLAKFSDNIPEESFISEMGFCQKVYEKTDKLSPSFALI